MRPILKDPIAATVHRFPLIDIYHVNDYHGALVPIYLLPKVLPTKEEMKEVCSAFNISKEHCTKYVQFGNTFNLLHVAASFISVHQKSIGVAGVSDKYGKRSWARYPALWTLKHVDSLPNPDPTDIAALDENPIALKEVKIDQVAESEQPEHKRQAQEWSNLKQDPNTDMFVFVGRWSKQKDVDVIADVMPSLLEKRPSIQLVCVGPVIYLYGRFAAEKLARLMELYPDRVYFKPEFTALPPYLFSGADFALIPSRDEPFGSVAVEFGRKGALGVCSRLGGLGLMPGWWFPVESTSAEHMMSQLTKIVKMALKSIEEERAMLRARSAVQRFPVVEWRQRMEDFHKRSIAASRGIAGSNAWRTEDCDGGANGRPIEEHDDWNPEFQAYPSQPAWDNRSINDRNSTASFLGQWTPGLTHTGELLPPQLGDDRRGSFSTDFSNNEGDYFAPDRISTAQPSHNYGNFLEKANKTIERPEACARSILGCCAVTALRCALARLFTDADGGVAQEFVQKLQGLNSHNSKGELSIDKYLQKSEEAFFDKHLWEAPLHPVKTVTAVGPLPDENGDVVMTGIQIAMSREFFSWPIYAIVIAAGQMLSATSFQITLLHCSLVRIGRRTLSCTCSVVSSLPLPAFGTFRLNLCSLGAMVVLRYRVHPDRLAIRHPCLASSSRCIDERGDMGLRYRVWRCVLFLLNFGEEAGAPTELWTMQACLVQGTQQIWVAALWYWGNSLNGSPLGTVPPW
ncbi:hypothetical protein EUX98_g9539 [Antrodiella citrinella]|uniref:alpha-1,3-glucan synthase n=1 Tax=Antrodiella citrinella TaxID=2447956 RepID=A0A4S4LTB4_9APHY|nr:hypothetical protein EUX98_g9539 [Antrodiella citrinella]